MKSEKSAGASRRSRRRALDAAVLVTIAIASLLVVRGGAADDESDVWSIDGGEQTRTDAQIATHLLQSVHGANDVLCAVVERAFRNGYWGTSIILPPERGVDREAAETAHWIGKRKISEDVFDIARPALASNDPCTRRVGARIVGSVRTRKLDDDLRSELSSPAVETRTAALLAIGYAEQKSALPTLVPLMRDSDPIIRAHAVWAVGRLEDKSTSPAITVLLQRDPDAEVRRVAAWALGNIHE